MPSPTLPAAPPPTRATCPGVHRPLLHITRLVDCWWAPVNKGRRSCLLGMEGSWVPVFVYRVRSLRDIRPFLASPSASCLWRRGAALPPVLRAPASPYDPSVKFDRRVISRKYIISSSFPPKAWPAPRGSVQVYCYLEDTTPRWGPAERQYLAPTPLCWMENVTTSTHVHTRDADCGPCHFLRTYVACQ